MTFRRSVHRGHLDDLDHEEEGEGEGDHDENAGEDDEQPGADSCPLLTGCIGGREWLEYPKTKLDSKHKTNKTY